MTLPEQLSLSVFDRIGPAALTMITIFTVAFLTQVRRSRSAEPTFVQRRLGLPKGVARWLVIGALAIATFPLLGIDLQGLWSTLVAALSLVAIGFVAMWSILSHMLASVLIVIFRPFEVGDRIEIVGDAPAVGEVLNLNPVYTTLRTEDGGTLQVPNNLFFQKPVKRQAPVVPALPQPSPA